MNIAAVLRSEISRLARKELKTETEALKKVSAKHRAEIAALKREVADLQRALETSRSQILELQQANALHRVVGMDDDGQPIAGDGRRLPAGDRRRAARQP